MLKNYFRILKKPHANLQTILKTPVKFQKDRTKTVGGVKGTKYLLKTRNHAPRTTRHAPRTTENQKQCPSTFLRKGGGQQGNSRAVNARLRNFQYARTGAIELLPSRDACCPALACGNYVHETSVKRRTKIVQEIT